MASTRKCQCDDCWWCFCVVVSGFTVGVGLIASVGGLIDRGCFFLFTFDDFVDDFLRLVVVVGEYRFKVEGLFWA